LPRACEQCHQDHHQGAYDDFVPASVREKPVATRKKAGPKNPQRTPGGVPCDYCHATQSWQKITFDHDATGFPLSGAHTRTGCSDCHIGGLARKLSQRCEFCHKDVHGGTLGIRCERCHDTNRWREIRDSVDAHRTTNFRLIGGHATVPCEECHGNVRDRTFRRISTRCETCHLKDIVTTVGTSIDHQAQMLTADCASCHTPVRWQLAQYRIHDKCFPITRGNHAGIPCLGCHTSPPMMAVTGICATGTAACSRCHLQPDMDRANTMVDGYEYKNGKCYGCHPNGRK
jgi:hypothetical protein